MRKSLIALAAVAVTIGTVVNWQLSISQGQFTPEDAKQQLITASTSQEQVAFYGVLEDGYPEEYAEFLQDMADFLNGIEGHAQQAARSGFEIGQEFTVNLRRDNGQYFATAPMDAFIVMRDANLANLKSMAVDPNMCARMALQGGAGLRLDDMERIDMDLMVASSRATFEALIAGRDRPQAHEQASQGDIRDVVDMWQLLPDVTATQIAAFFSNNPNNPETCSAHISFETFLNTSDDLLVQKVAVTLMLMASGL